MKRVLNLWCQCDTEMWSLGVALQHTKAGIHRVTFSRLVMVSDHLKKIVLSPEFNVLKTAPAPCLFAKWKVKMKSFANRRLALSSHVKKSHKNKRPKNNEEFHCLQRDSLLRETLITQYLFMDGRGLPGVRVFPYLWLRKFYFRLYTPHQWSATDSWQGVIVTPFAAHYLLVRRPFWYEGREAGSTHWHRSSLGPIQFGKGLT